MRPKLSKINLTEYALSAYKVVEIHNVYLYSNIFLTLCNSYHFQAPVSMKSCIMAGWLMTVSVGNAIVVVFAEARLTDNMVRICTLRDAWLWYI